MPLDIIVVTEDPQESVLLPSGREIFESLAPAEDMGRATIYVSELLGRLFDQIRQTIDFDCAVEVTVSGALSLKGRGELKYLIFNVGGEAQTQTTMTVKLATSLAPSRSPT